MLAKEIFAKYSFLNIGFAGLMAALDLLKEEEMKVKIENFYREFGNKVKWIYIIILKIEWYWMAIRLYLWRARERRWAANRGKHPGGWGRKKHEYWGEAYIRD